MIHYFLTSPKAMLPPNPLIRMWDMPHAPDIIQPVEAFMYSSHDFHFSVASPKFIYSTTVFPIPPPTSTINIWLSLQPGLKLCHPQHLTSHHTSTTASISYNSLNHSHFLLLTPSHTPSQFALSQALYIISSRCIIHSSLPVRRQIKLIPVLYIK